MQAMSTSFNFSPISFSTHTVRESLAICMSLLTRLNPSYFPVGLQEINELLSHWSQWANDNGELDMEGFRKGLASVGITDIVIVQVRPSVGFRSHPLTLCSWLGELVCV